jgi:rhamnose transport system permease protein
MKRSELVTGALVVLAFIGGVIESPYFLNFPYLLDKSSMYVEQGFLALGMTFVIVAGQIDLSVASAMVLVAAVTAKLLDAGWPLWAGSLAGIALGCALGALNGVLVARVRLPSFMVTLASLAAFRGIAQAMLGAQSAPLPASFKGIDQMHIPGTPIAAPLVLLVLAAVLAALLLHRSEFGRWVFSVGTNPKASVFSGIPARAVALWVFVLSGLCAGIGGLLIDSRLGVARYDLAKGWELDVITAVVLGGASISGGKGSILGTMLAALLLFFVRTGMGVANVTDDYQLTVIGALLVVTVLVRTTFERKGRLSSHAA